MGKGSNLYFQQQQARQLRELERHQAEQSGLPLRPLTWNERNVLGVKDPAPEPAETDGPVKPTWTQRLEADNERRLQARRERKQAKRDAKGAARDAKQTARDANMARRD